MATKISFGAVVLTGLFLAPAARASDVRLRVGETKAISFGKTEGVVLDNPSVAEVRISKGERVEIVGKRGGEGTLTVFTAGGKSQSLRLSVTAEARASDVRLRVGETKAMSFGKAEGVVLDNPSVAEVRISKGERVEIVGARGGEGTLTVFTGGGKTQSFRLSVAAEAGEGEDDEDAEIVPTFGGKRIAGALCDDPLEGKPTAQALDRGRVLADRGEVRKAISTVKNALEEDPRAAVLHLFLGAAWAKLQDQAKGAYHYETFALSCPDHPAGKVVARVLREFNRVTSAR